MSKNPKYNDDVKAIDAQFDNLLDSQNGVVTISSLFFKAKELGFNYPDLEIEGLFESGEVAQPKTTPSPSLADLLRERFAFDDVRDLSKPLGYPLEKFKELSKNIDGLQAGFYIIAADSSVGKTAFLTNLCLDLINTNPEVDVVYLSLDDNKLYTVYRFLSIMTQFHINDVRKKCPDPNNQNTLEAKREFLIQLAEKGRLAIYDQADVWRVDQIEELLKSLGDTKNLVLFIDGLYNLEVDSSNQGIRVENIERAKSIKAIVDKYLIPVVSTGELRKKGQNEKIDKESTYHDIMETGKFVYNANVVWLLSIKNRDINIEEPIINLRFAKNKLSDFRGAQELRFKRATGTMEEFNLFTSMTTTPSAAASTVAGPFQGGDIE